MNQTKVPDLGIQLYELMAQTLPVHADQWRALFLDVHPGWIGPEHLPDVSIQMRDINAYWRKQLGMYAYVESGIDTIPARQALVDHIDPRTWISNYRRYIVPTLQQLPPPVLNWHGV